MAEKTVCFFREKCFNRHASHFLEFSHPHLESLENPPEGVTYRKQYNILFNLGLIRVKTESNDSKSTNSASPSRDFEKEQSEEHIEKDEEIQKTKIQKLENDLKIERAKNLDMACQFEKLQKDFQESENKRLQSQKEVEMLQKEIQFHKCGSNTKKISDNIASDCKNTDQDLIQNEKDKFEHSSKRKREELGENKSEANMNEGLIFAIENMRDSFYGSHERIDRIKYSAFDKAASAIKNYPYKITKVPEPKQIKDVGPSTCEIIRKYLDKNSN